MVWGDINSWVSGLPHCTTMTSNINSINNMNIIHPSQPNCLAQTVPCYYNYGIRIAWLPESHSLHLVHFVVESQSLCQSSKSLSLCRDLDRELSLYQKSRQVSKIINGRGTLSLLYTIWLVIFAGINFQKSGPKFGFLNFQNFTILSKHTDSQFVR